MKKRILLLLLIIPIFGFTQTDEERAEIASHSNKEANAQLLQELKMQDEQRKIRLENYLQNNPEVSKIVYNDEKGKKEIMDVLPNGEFIYAETDNSGAATTARATPLYNGGSLGINIQGQGMTAGVWDGGSVRDTHQEFMVGGASKVTNMNSGTAFEDHATHVAGTIAAQGINSNVRGLAFNANITSYDWNSDLSEMLAEASAGLLMSNHSYGIGQLGSIWFFGAYDSRARQMDQICNANPYYLPVVSAGNERNETSPPASTQITNKGGYDLVKGHANAKNVMTVAAVGQVNSYVNASSVVMSSFSSWGPSDDGRIKPDISMKGVNVRSTLSNSDTATGFMSGTSMSSPGITGVVTLLQQYYNSLYSSYMRAATVKGLILHTADEAGSFEGPDYEFGWGLVNAEKAAVTIRDKNLSQNGSLIEENVLQNGQIFTKTISTSSTMPLKVSISWTDPASNNSNSGTEDPSTVYLVNDLDVKVTSNGVDNYPWKLQGMASPWDVATKTGTNNVDNFERVDVQNPNGVYTIAVSHKGTLVGNSQPFSLIVTSSNLTTLGVNDVMNSDSSDLEIYPNPVDNILYFNVKEKGSAKIYDLSGRLILEGTITDGKINVKDIRKGSYLLEYKNDNQKSTVKFIKN